MFPMLSKKVKKLNHEGVGNETGFHAINIVCCAKLYEIIVKLSKKLVDDVVVLPLRFKLMSISDGTAMLPGLPGPSLDVGLKTAVNTR
jgi:hypothetical protein